jgi:hypothetical protein
MIRKHVTKRIGSLLEVSSKEFSLSEEHNIRVVGEDELPEGSNCRR